MIHGRIPNQRLVTLQNEKIIDVLSCSPYFCVILLLSTTKNQQGNDVGQQYASVIFCDDEEQKQIAQRIISDLQQLVKDGKVKYINKVITTDVVSTSKFTAAQEDHQVR
jgi:peptide methionine sulfoxide reductase MsrA